MDIIMFFLLLIVDLTVIDMVISLFLGIIAIIKPNRVKLLFKKKDCYVGIYFEKDALHTYWYISVFPTVVFKVIFDEQPEYKKPESAKYVEDAIHDIWEALGEFFSEELGAYIPYDLKDSIQKAIWDIEIAKSISAPLTDHLFYFKYMYRHGIPDRFKEDVLASYHFAYNIEDLKHIKRSLEIWIGREIEESTFSNIVENMSEWFFCSSNLIIDRLWIRKEIEKKIKKGEYLIMSEPYTKKEEK